MKTPGVSAPPTGALSRERPVETSTPARQAPARPANAKTRPDAAFSGLTPRVKGPRSAAPPPRAAGLTKSQAQLQTLTQKGRPVSAEALEQADEEALQTALLVSMQAPPRHTGAMSGQQAGIVGGQAAGFKVGQHTIEQANRAAFQAGLAVSGARPLPPIPTGPRPEGPRSSAQSPAAMSPLQTRIVNAQLAGRPVTSRKLEHANDAALAAALQESLDSPAHDGAMSPHQAGVLNALEAGHGVDADALQIADDEALAMAIAQSLGEEQGAQPAQHPASHAAPTSPPESRPEHAPSEAPPHDVAAQMKSMQDFQSHQMAITHAQHKVQASTKGAEAMVQLTSHI
ncbi:hypothetical protein M0D69_03740 [Caballeronia sp. SEWSISQ10-4 2]|uniref:hypothetical protein n=1 Tax=Caballeronia sp. SEWSISQ10-4 2 TaxID=2937438 RepID=UPI002656D3AA|nr:hypothetical protein [Caballeronia sp. SEWSISQ10-4 2]MDN7177136.1 hypothetical protein [Caballeronia sp. SEWSISQ10-4 2]